MAPIAASSESKSKLRAFHYDPKDDSTVTKTADTGKENQDPELDTTILKMDPPPQPLSQRSATKDLRDCPQTPLGRLPLTDLLAGDDDTSRQHLNLTPIERVLWENSPVSSGPAKLRQGSRKRAHSSSPASSSQNDASHHFEDSKPQVDLQALQKALKTPKADPADDLWSRYTLNTGIMDRQSPTTHAGLAFTQLIHSSSPQTPASHLQSKEANGLRRALSCIEWPTSAAKRRKLQMSGTYKDSNGGFARIEGGPNASDDSKMSRVSFLIEKIHDGLTKASATNEYSSSGPVRSSPVVQNFNESAKRLDLPSQGRQTEIDDVVTVLSQTAVAPKDSPPLPLVLSAEEIADLEKADGSSDFGDDDLDLEMLETVDATIKFSPAKQKTASPKRGNSQFLASRGTITDDPKKHIRETHQPGSAQVTPEDTERLSQVSFPSGYSSSPIQAGPPKYDEFDENEDEVSAADLENMFAQYDTQPQHHVARDEDRRAKPADAAHPTIATKVPRKSIFRPHTAINTEVQVLSDDDDFGEDSDFEQIAAECAEKQQVSQPLSSVRTIKFGSSTF